MAIAQLEEGYEIAGYRIGNLIGSGSKGHVYRASKNGQPYALKIIASQNRNDSSEALNFNRETAVAARFRHPAIAQVFDFGQEGEIYYIAMELADGDTLQAALQKNPMSPAQAVDVGIALASALQDVHNFGYVHRDVKPENIVICSNGDLKLIDFGLAGGLEDFSLSSSKQDAIGTFDYASPEQSGVLQRTVDGRSDLYSVGVVLFQCLAGQLPFVSDDLSELLTMHAQHKPRLLREINPTVSPVLEKIVEKLLQKDPDARYQSAAGLLFDLQNLKSLDATLLETRQINLGSQDLSSSAVVQMPLFGRKPELSYLSNQLQPALGGKGNCIVVEGEGGLGKSRLAREVILKAESAGTLVLMAKCRSQERDVPYAVFKQALDHYLFQIKQMPEDQRSRHESAIREAAKNNQATLVRLNSRLRTILGPVSINDALVDMETFAISLRNFFCDLTDLQQGLVLYLDDVQWMDSGSLAIVNSIFQVIQNKKLFLLATARNDEDSKNWVEKFVQAAPRDILFRLPLKPLDLSMTAEIAKSYLGGRDVAPEIIEKLYSFSGGNPFVLTENITQLISSGCLKILDGKWQLNQLEFSRVGLSENVYELVLARVNRLGSRIQSMLQFAAVIGTNFNLSVLSQVMSVSEVSLKDDLMTSVRANVIEVFEGSEYRFVHDRIREALISTLNSENLRKINDQLAEALEALSDISESQTYELARYASLGNSDQNPSRAFRALVRAGQCAKAANASEQAYSYFSQAAQYEDRSQVSAQSLLSFLMDYSSMATELGHLSLAHRLLDRALALANKTFERAQILNLRSQALAHLAPYGQCWDSDMQLLSQTGQKLPESALLGVVSAVAYLIRHLLITFPPLRQIKSKTMKEECLLSSHIYERMTITGYFTGRKVIMLPIGIRFLFYARLLGPSMQLVRAHGYLGQVASILGVRPWMQYHLRKSIETATKMGSKNALLLSAITESIARERIGDDKIAEALYVDSMPDIEKYMTTMNFGLAWGGLGLFYYMRGKNSESIALVLRNLPRTDRMNRLGGMVTLRFMLYHQLWILGRQSEASEVYNFIKENLPKLGPKSPYAWANFHASQFVIQYESGELLDNLEAEIEAFEKFQLDSLHFYIYYAYIGYIRLFQYQNAKTDLQKSQAMARLESHLKVIKKVLKVPVGQAHLSILQAAYLRLKGQYRDADRALQKAEHLAQKAGSVYAQFMLMQEKSRLAFAQNHEMEARLHSRMAYEMAIRNSWPLRAKQVAQEFSIDVQSHTADSDQSNATEDIVHAPQDDRIAQSLLRMSLVSSFEMNSEKQIQLSLDEIVKVMGAERSYVFLLDPQDGTMKYAGGRDQNNQDLAEPTGYSTTVVKKVAESGQSLIVMGDDQIEALGSKSAVIHGLRSILASPLLLKGELKGVVYVDSSVSKNLFTNHDTELLSAIASHIAISFENLRMMNIEASKREMHKDLELSAAVQAMLFPKVQEFSNADIRIYGINRPAVQCGGDWWWHEMTDSKTAQFFVGDVTGHGAGPAMITSFLAACFKMARQTAKSLKMPDLLKAISQLVFDLTQGDYLVSAIAAEVDTKARKLTCWNCGSFGLYVIPREGPIVSIGDIGSLIGGKEFNVEPVEISLKPGDRVFIPTDGFIEQALPDGQTFGRRRILKLLEQTRHLPTKECLPTMIKVLDDHRKDFAQEDDITLIYFEIL